MATGGALLEFQSEPQSGSSSVRGAHDRRNYGQIGSALGVEREGSDKIKDIQSSGSTPKERLGALEGVVVGAGGIVGLVAIHGRLHLLELLFGQEIAANCTTHQQGLAYQGKNTFANIALAHLTNTRNDGTEQASPIVVHIDVLATIPDRWNIFAGAYLA